MFTSVNGYQEQCWRRRTEYCCQNLVKKRNLTACRQLTNCWALTAVSKPSHDEQFVFHLQPFDLFHSYYSLNIVFLWSKLKCKVVICSDEGFYDAQRCSRFSQISQMYSQRLHECKWQSKQLCLSVVSRKARFERRRHPVSSPSKKLKIFFPLHLVKTMETFFTFTKNVRRGKVRSACRARQKWSLCVHFRASFCIATLRRTFHQKSSGLFQNQLSRRESIRRRKMLPLRYETWSVVFCWDQNISTIFLSLEASKCFCFCRRNLSSTTK